ncbi:MAG: BTAD domain-containing putative transcriptional regulator [Solirubrobacteraceae bacterium]
MILARALGRTGKHAQALEPLIDAFRERPTDEALLADLLHSEAALRGPAAALERYEDYRRELRERLGTNPGELLQRVQRELLALDQPVRRGLRYDATALLGRDGDLEALRGLLASARVVSSADGDLDAAVQLLAPLGMFWTIRGEHIRLVTLAAVLAGAIGDWSPAPELENVARAAAAIVLTNAMIAGDQRAAPLRALLERLGTDTGGDGRLSGAVKVVLAFEQSDPSGVRRALEALAEDPDRRTALVANQWLCHSLENAGDPLGATAAARRALDLVGPQDGPWQEGALRNQLAQLSMHVGDRRAATEHARLSLPIMERLGARDDEVHLRGLMAMCAVADGRLQDADAELAAIERIAESGGGLFSGLWVWQIPRAELLLARSRFQEGLALHRECVERMRGLGMPGIPRTGPEPWVCSARRRRSPPTPSTPRARRSSPAGESCSARPGSTPSARSAPATCTWTIRSPACSRSGSACGRTCGTPPRSCSRPASGVTTEPSPITR